VWSLSTAAGLRLAESHTISVRAVATSPAHGSVEVPVISGSVTVDSGSQTRRTATVGIADPALWPADAWGALSPLGAELAVWYGIGLRGGNTEWVPLITGPVTNVKRTRPAGTDDPITVEVSDRSATVAQARFDAPTQTIAGATTVAEITRLITEAMPSVGVLDYTANKTVAQVLDMERERWADGIEKLADSISAEVFCDQVGTFVIRPEPTLGGEVVWAITDDADYGVLVTQNDEFTREMTYNKVVASGQRTDGTPPVFWAEPDVNPLSPTNIYGPLGVRTRFYSSPLLTTQGACMSAAKSLLARVAGQHLSVELDNIVNPTLDAGDVISLRHGGDTSLHIIDTVTIPLTPGDPQHITIRTPAIPEETS
jgi:Domain of unknown function (DUF5047)